MLYYITLYYAVLCYTAYQEPPRPAAALRAGGRRRRRGLPRAAGRLEEGKYMNT